MESIYIKVPNQDNHINEEKIHQLTKTINNKYPNVNFKSITSEYSVIVNYSQINRVDNEVDN